VVLSKQNWETVKTTYEFRFEVRMCTINAWFKWYLNTSSCCQNIENVKRYIDSVLVSSKLGFLFMHT
jgi:hypothetical protein